MGCIVWFWEISIPTPRLIIGNSTGEGLSKANKESMKLNLIFQRGQDMDIFWNHNFLVS